MVMRLTPSIGSSTMKLLDMRLSWLLAEPVRVDHAVTKRLVAVLECDLEAVLLHVGLELLATRALTEMRPCVHLGGAALQRARTLELQRHVDDALVRREHVGVDAADTTRKL